MYIYTYCMPAIHSDVLILLYFELHINTIMSMMKILAQIITEMATVVGRAPETSCVKPKIAAQATEVIRDRVFSNRKN